MKSFSFDHLTSVEFEELCYDLLLLEEGFKNFSWRKGTGYNSSPADQGRDIEGQREIKIGGKFITEKWFFECKHHKAGIPPDKIQSALAWAEAESPRYLIFIASNFFSNPTKEYIDRYKNTRRPPFHIETFENKDLERMLIKQPHIREKYNINTGTIDIELPSNMHKWKNDSLAKVFKFMMDNSKYSNVCFRSIRKDSEQVYVINLPIEYADSLNKLLDEELPNELKGTYDDLELLREVHTPFDFSKMDLGKVKGFFPVIINISPFNNIKSFLKRGE